MPQSCPSCLWVSSDDAEVCERCGERFDGKPAPVITAGTAGTVGSWVQAVVGVFALALLAYLLFRRFGGNAPHLTDTLKAAAVSFYIWLLGPNEFFKPYLIIIVVVTIITWVVLWLLARFQQS